MPTNTELRLAVDIGGTFTDTVLLRGKSTVLGSAKTATTTDNPAIGAIEGARIVLQQSGRALSEVTSFVHGTTLATNALIERRGCEVATITSQGFRNILEIAYERRYSQYDINLSKPDLIVPRRRSFTVPERVMADGSVHTPLDETCVDTLITSLDNEGIDAVAICLLHSYVNSSHEERLRDLLLARKPDLAISMSSEISPEAREFERLCTTIANAYVQPMMSDYLSEFSKRFQSEGLNCSILMMTSGGGMTSIETAASHPIRLVESGPAGGAILATHVAELLCEESVLSFDMGGTTAKLCLIDGYRPQTSRKFEISRAERFIRGSGMPVRIPVIDMIEIGAGGGSIASVDRLGRIQVGPQSAGSEPGPAAFGKGGIQPTVTDADTVLGLIDPQHFAEGRLKIDREAASNALVRSVGDALGIDAQQAADGMSQIVDESMASAGRMHAVEAGKDLANRTMIAFGGNGPLHATRLARRAGVNRIIIPNEPGVGSAVGFLFAPVSYEIVQSRYTILENMDLKIVNTMFDDMTDTALSVVRTGSSTDNFIRRCVAYMRYHGQGHEIEVALPDRPLAQSDIAQLLLSFEKEYQRQFSRTVPGMTVEILNWAVTVSTLQPSVDPLTTTCPQREAHAVGQREIWCDVTSEAVLADVYLRSELEPGATLKGPALIIEPQTTTFVSADFSASVLVGGMILLSRKSQEHD